MLLQAAKALLHRIPKGHADLVDQLRRAAQSIPQNIAEGAGKTGRADKARYYAIARGSAMECAADPRRDEDRRTDRRRTPCPRCRIARTRRCMLTKMIDP
ncbi:MAG: four helix bundle protein [Kofleriaceae bacterium]